jgi:RES domain-containing protein
MPTTQPDLDPRSKNQVLDKALADTFPASDPPAATSITPAVPDDAGPAAGDCPLQAWLVVDETMAAKKLEDWRTCGQARWLSPNTPSLQLALSPALALLDALTSHGFDQDKNLLLARIETDARLMRRLDTPHECWRERTFRNDVRLHGDRWALERESALLRVPSPLCPNEYNVLVNLLHPDAASLRLAETCPLEIDSRLRR